MTALPGLQVSICICTYNGASRLLPVLEALAEQTAHSESWELLVIDNASTDETAALATSFLRSRFGRRGRVVSEPRAGLSFARHRAGLEAASPIVCFLDDDNIAAEDFVEKIPRAFERYPRAGVIGGQVLPEWEAPPTPLAASVAGYALAICQMGEKPFVYEWIGHGPVGAGMCIRRDLLLAACESPDFCAAVTDRKGQSLMSGGDMALAIYAAQAGYERRYEPSIILRHQLPRGRMEKGYLLRLYEGIGRGQACTRRLYARFGRSRFMAFLIAVKDSLLWLGHSFRPLMSVIREPGCPALKSDLRDLERRLLVGRIREAVVFAFRRSASIRIRPPEEMPGHSSSAQ